MHGCLFDYSFSQVSPLRFGFEKALNRGDDLRYIMPPKLKSYHEARIAFVHGRPGPHPTHVALAKSVNADFIFVDRLLRYHDLDSSGRVRRYLSWLLNSVFFENVKDYDLILSEGMHVTPVLMKKLRILGRHQRTAAILGDEFLFFLKTEWYPIKTRRLLSYFLRQYDVLLCMSEFQTELANEVLEGFEDGPRVVTAHEIISGGRPMASEKETPDRDGHRLLFVAHGPDGWRAYYKGIETLLETFHLVSQKFSDAQLIVVGDWTGEFINNLMAKTKNEGANIQFVGRQSDLPSFFNNADLCVHITNGDAFPIATLEAIRAGLPTMVSELTGTKEVVAKIDKNLVVPMNPEAATQQIEWYFRLPPESRKAISTKGREVMLDYSEEKGLEEFRNAVNDILTN